MPSETSSANVCACGRSGDGDPTLAEKTPLVGASSVYAEGMGLTVNDPSFVITSVVEIALRQLCLLLVLEGFRSTEEGWWEHTILSTRQLPCGM